MAPAARGRVRAGVGKPSQLRDERRRLDEPLAVRPPPRAQCDLRSGPRPHDRVRGQRRERPLVARAVRNARMDQARGGRDATHGAPVPLRDLRRTPRPHDRVRRLGPQRPLGAFARGHAGLEPDRPLGHAAERTLRAHGDLRPGARPDDRLWRLCLVDDQRRLGALALGCSGLDPARAHRDRACRPLLARRPLRSRARPHAGSRGPVGRRRPLRRRLGAVAGRHAGLEPGHGPGHASRSALQPQCDLRRRPRPPGDVRRRSHAHEQLRSALGRAVDAEPGGDAGVGAGAARGGVARTARGTYRHPRCGPRSHGGVRRKRRQHARLRRHLVAAARGRARVDAARAGRRAAQSARRACRGLRCPAPPHGRLRGFGARRCLVARCRPRPDLDPALPDGDTAERAGRSHRDPRSGRRSHDRIRRRRAERSLGAGALGRHRLDPAYPAGDFAARPQRPLRNLRPGSPAHDRIRRQRAQRRLGTDALGSAGVERNRPIGHGPQRARRTRGHLRPSGGPDDRLRGLGGRGVGADPGRRARVAPALPVRRPARIAARVHGDLRSSPRAGRDLRRGQLRLDHRRRLGAGAHEPSRVVEALAGGRRRAPVGAHGGLRSARGPDGGLRGRALELRGVLHAARRRARAGLGEPHTGSGLAGFGRGRAGPRAADVAHERPRGRRGSGLALPVRRGLGAHWGRRPRRLRLDALRGPHGSCGAALRLSARPP